MRLLIEVNIGYIESMHDVGDTVCSCVHNSSFSVSVGCLLSGHTLEKCPFFVNELDSEPAEMLCDHCYMSTYNFPATSFASARCK